MSQVINSAQFHRHAKRHMNSQRKTEVRVINKGRHGAIRQGEWRKSANHG